MAIFYTDSGSFNSVQVTGSANISASSGIALQVKSSGSTVFSVSGSSGEIFNISDINNNNLFSVSSGSVGIFSIDNTKAVRISGSLIVTGSITGSLFGTSSYATQALSSSFASTASFVNPLIQDVQLSGSMFATGSRFIFRTTGTVDAVTITGSTGAYGNSIVNINALNQGNQNGLRIFNLGAGDSGISIQRAEGSVLQLNVTSLDVTNRNFTFNSINNAYDSSGVSYIFADRDKSSTHQKTFLIRGSTNTFKSGSYFEVQKSGSIPILHLSGDAQSGSFSPNELYISGSLRVNSGNSVITGSLTVVSGNARELQVTSAGVSMGNVITDTHTVTGSLNVSGSVTATSFTGSLRGTASYALNALTASYALTSGGGGGGVSFVGGTNVDNRIITATGATPELEGEANLTFDGSILSVTGTVTANSFTGSLEGTASYAETSKLTNNLYFAQGALSGNQGIPDSTDTIIQFVDQFDPQGWYDSGTYKFIPNIAGYYTVSLGVTLENTSNNTGYVLIQILKNSSTREMFCQQPLNVVSDSSLFGSKIIYLDGNTDYLEFIIYQSSGGTFNILEGPGGQSPDTWFSATYMTM